MSSVSVETPPHPAAPRVYTDDVTRRITESHTRCAFCTAEPSTLCFSALEVITQLRWCAFYDTEARYHNHDPNVTAGTFSCSNGHVGRVVFTALPCRVCEPSEPREVEWTLLLRDNASPPPPR